MPLDETQALIRSAAISPSTFDPEAGTVEAVASTFADVQRSGYVERLDSSAIDPEKLVGLPVLDGHRNGRAADVVGKIVAARMEGRSLMVTIKRTKATDADGVWDRVADGTITGVSIGFRVRQWRETIEGGRRVRTAVDWAIREVSVVADPADPQATFRQNKEPPMPDPVIETPTPEEAERTRRAEIRTIYRSAGLPSEQADELIDSGATVDEAKAAAYDQMQTRSRPVIRTHTPANDDPTVIRDRQSDALHIRMAGGDPKPEVRPHMGESLLDMARGSLTRAGISTRGLSPDEVFTRAGEATTSDFPLIVSNAANKTALASYQAASSPLKMLGRQRSLANFKTATSIRIGEMGRLEELDESGEITHTSRAENGETMQLSTYARAINVSRKLMIDDDLGLLGDMTAACGEAAAQAEADILVSLVTGNPNLSDGTAVFDASRGNVAASGADPSETTLDEARKAMRGFKGLDGATLINVVPKYLLIGPELETAAEKLLASIYAATTEDVNPFTGKLSLLVEPRITDDSWFIFADPARLAALQYGYLSSAQGVQIQRAESWSTLGLKFRAWLDFGAGWLDWRGAYHNEGAGS